jgi:hypothetical protein
MIKRRFIKSQAVIYFKMKQGIKKAIHDQSGMGMVEIAIIIIIIIALGLTFKKAINDFLVSIFDSFDLGGY